MEHFSFEIFNHSGSLSVRVFMRHNFAAIVPPENHLLALAFYCYDGGVISVRLLTGADMLNVKSKSEQQNMSIDDS